MYCLQAKNAEEPFKDPYRRITPGLIEEVREHFREMLDAGAIRNSESPYSSNVVIVRKKDGSILSVLTSGSSTAALSRIHMQSPA